MTVTPPGWYDDGSGALRWWDGTAWTEHVHAADAAPVAGSDGIDALGLRDSAGQEIAATAAPVPEGAGPAGWQGYGPPAAGYPGAATQEAPPKRSRWWIWVVAGAAVLVAFIILAVILVPLAIRAIAGGVGGGSGDEQAAVQAVQDYDRAWQTVDCDLMISVTTDDFREYYDLADCATFEQQAEDLGDTTDDYRVEITSVSAGEDGSVTVETTETYTSSVDENGEDTGAVEPYADSYTYLVVPSDGDWLIDDAAIE